MTPENSEAPREEPGADLVASYGEKLEERIERAEAEPAPIEVPPAETLIGEQP